MNSNSITQLVFQLGVLLVALSLFAVSGTSAAAPFQLRPLEPVQSLNDGGAQTNIGVTPVELWEQVRWIDEELERTFSSEPLSDVFHSVIVEGTIVAAAEPEVNGTNIPHSEVPVVNSLEVPVKDLSPPEAQRLAKNEPSPTAIMIDTTSVVLATAGTQIGEEDTESESDIESETSVSDTTSSSESESEEPASPAQDETQEVSDEAQLLQRLKRVKTTISDDEQMDKLQKNDRLELVNSAKNSLINANSLRTQKGQYDNQLASFPEELKRLTEITDSTEEFEPWVVEKDVSSDSLQTDLQKQQQKLSEQKQLFEDYDSEISRLNSRITEIPVLRSKVEEELTKVDAALEKLPAQNEDLDTKLRWMVQQAKKFALEAELETLDSESRRQELAGKVFPMKRDEASRQIKRLETRIADMEKAIDELRQIEVQQQAEQARLEAINADPALRDLANRNQELTQLRSNITVRFRKSQFELEEVNALVDSLSNEKDQLAREIEAAGGVNKTNGMMLVESRRRLASPFESLARIKEIQAELQTINVALLTLEEERRPLADPVAFINEHLELEQRPGFDAGLKEMAIKFAQTKRQYLDGLLKDYNLHRGVLTKLEVRRGELVSQIASNRTFIDEKALWVRNADPISMQDVSESTEALGAFFDTGSWRELGVGLKERLFSKPHEAALGFCGLVVMVLASRRLKSK